MVVIGDGSKPPVHFSGDKLGKQDEMIQGGKDLELPTSIKDTRQMLGEKVFEYVLPKLN